MRKWLIAGALLLAATPALANWGKTTWGMTPAQVIAAVPGASAQEASDDTILMGMPQLAAAKVTEGKFKLTAGFHFAPDTNGLAMIDLVMDDRTQCPDYRKALTARLGEGHVTVNPLKVENYELTQIMVEWTDPANGDRLIFAGAFLDKNQSDYGLCKLILRTPGN